MTTTQQAPESPSLGDDLRRGREEARALGAAVAQITEELRGLAQAEVQLAQAEVSDNIAALTRGAMYGAVAAVVGLIALVFLARTLMAVLDGPVGLSEWLAALITAVVLLVITGVLGMLAMGKFKQFSVVPKRTIASVREDVTWAREQIKRNNA